MLRITGGQFKGKSIDSLPGKDIRPTSSKTRQGIFNVLFSMGFDVEGARVVELFAGTGLISFESISRGALEAVLVDNARSSLKVIEGNVEKLNIKNRVRLIYDDALAFINKNDLKGFDLVYLDPPYSYKCYEQLLGELFGKIDSGCVLIAESGRELPVSNTPKDVELIKVKKWGKSFAHFFRKC